MISFGGSKPGVTFSTLPDQRCSPYWRGHLEAHKPWYHGTFQALISGGGMLVLEGQSAVLGVHAARKSQAGTTRMVGLFAS